MSGGSSEANQHTSNTQNTSNQATNTDLRAVASDAAVSITGSGSSVDRSDRSQTSFADSSNRSTNFADSSQRNTDSSVKFSDSSQRTTITNSTDYGSVAGAMNLTGRLTEQAFHSNGDALKAGFDSLKNQSLKSAELANSFMNGVGDMSRQSVADVVGLARVAITENGNAYAVARDGGSQKIMLYLIAAVAVIGVGMTYSMGK